MSHLEILFPVEISYGAQGGPEFQTRVIATGAGFESRNQNWQLFRGRWNVSHGVKSLAQGAILRQFFIEVRGRLYSFNYKDWFDFVASNTPFGVGDGTTTVFPLYKRYGTTNPYDRRIVKPSLVTAITANDVDQTGNFTVDMTTGIVTFNTAPLDTHVLRWTGEFNLPVRFDVDHFNATYTAFDVLDWDNIVVVEMRPEDVL